MGCEYVSVLCYADQIASSFLGFSLNFNRLSLPKLMKDCMHAIFDIHFISYCINYSSCELLLFAPNFDIFQTETSIAAQLHLKAVDSLMIQFGQIAYCRL